MYFVKKFRYIIQFDANTIEAKWPNSNDYFLNTCSRTMFETGIVKNSRGIVKSYDKKRMPFHSKRICLLCKSSVESLIHAI